ncbi:zinc fingers and homeoboxes protein 1-like [Hippocampus comes]|uniref:zinc fingers and homeoboxes protein 1-like n=1 Tax=Hippocampus comes TaxID=109280 RepID=UPI00094E1A03|nr:PREDICTED: zinc fingers and homeoboxes protein 1-like [Hippocampus comes]
MASRRKSSTPCMLPPPPSGGDAGDADRAEDRGVAEPSSKSYECKYCSFGAQTLKLFAGHVDSGHADGVTDALDVCVACHRRTRSDDALATRDLRHQPGQGKSTHAAAGHSDQTGDRRTFDDSAPEGRPLETQDDARPEDGGRRHDDACCQGIALSKTPIMRSRAEPKKFTASRRTAAEDVIKVESEDETDEDNAAPAFSAAAAPPPLPVPAPLQLLTGLPQSLVLNCPDALHVQGGGGGALPAGTLAQVLSVLQKQNQNQLLIPISSIPAYHAAMDNNVLLLGAYNRFPYPSPSEIAALASQTKFSEENVKVWFSAQRLKHGVSWTPEEVEEERKKTSNGAVQTLHPSVPHAIAVIPAGVAANGLRSIFQTCQIVGPPGLVLAQVGGRADVNLPAAAPVALTVAGVPAPRSKAPEAPEAAAEPPAERASSSAASDSASKTKKSKEQLAELKASYGRRRFATDVEISRLMQVTGLSKRAIKKWFSDTRYNQRNSRDLQHGSGAVGVQAGRNDDKDSAAPAIVIDSSDDAGDFAASGNRGSPRLPRERRAKLRHAFPDFTPQKFKEKTSGQLLILESSFRKCDTPSDDELMRLRTQTKLTRREVDAWFSDRRKGVVPKGGGGGEAAPPASPPPVGRRVLKKTPAQLEILKKAFVRSRWPTAQEYDEMARDCGLPRNYVVNWFGDTRYAAKNSNLKWFDLYHGGKVDETSPDGAAGMPKKSRKRFRGWSRRTRRAYVGKQDVRAPGKAKNGKAFLRAYFLQQRVLSEDHLGDLAAKSDMSEQQIREWFSEVGRRAAEGREPFGDRDQEAERQEQRAEERGDGEEAEEGQGRPEDDVFQQASPGGNRSGCPT